MFHLHPSAALREAFARKPYQGAAPEDARYIFVGLDANYAEAIESSPIWQDLLDYLEDGVRFWRERGVHHSFLLPGYRGDGRKYHRTFAKIGFQSEQAGEVCFVELVNVPTFGRSSLGVADLANDHLTRLREAIETGRPLKLWCALGEKRIHWHYHFSVYGKLEARKEAQLSAMQKLRRDAEGMRQCGLRRIALPP